MFESAFSQKILKLSKKTIFDIFSISTPNSENFQKNAILEKFFFMKSK